MLSHYLLNLTKEGYKFTTDLDITYHLYFTDYYLKDEDGEAIKVKSFGFYTEPSFTRRVGVVYRYDPRISLTIAHVIAEYFRNNEDAALLYFCSTDHGYARHRKIVFNKWFAALGDMSVAKFDCREKHENADFYTSVLVRDDSLLKYYYVDAFYRGLDELFDAIAALSDPSTKQIAG